MEEWYYCIKDYCNFEGNYRTVSILPAVSKVFERIVHQQLCEYVEGKNFIYEFQSGFRSTISTNTTLTYLRDTIRFNRARDITSIVLLD